MMNSQSSRKWFGPGVVAMFALVSLCVLWFPTLPSEAKSPDLGVACRVEAVRDVLPTGGPQKVVVKVTLDAPKPGKKTERPPVNLSIVVDRSGSMKGEKIEKARDAAIEALRRLGHKDVFSVVVYNQTVETAVPAQKVKNIGRIEAQIKKIQAGGRTALFGGVSRGAGEIRKNIEEKYVHRIILLSDGLANVGPSSPEELGRLGVALIKEGISVTTVGVGVDYNEDLMTRLSQNSDGNAYFVESGMDLPRIFAAELGDVLSIVAKKVRMTVECPDRVKPVRIVGREGRIKGRTVEISMNQLYGGQEKYALIELEVPRAKTGEKLKIAEARISYHNPFTGRSGTASGKVTVRFSGDKVKVEKSINARVQKALELTLNAMAQEKAIKLADRGKTGEAVRELNKSLLRLKEAAVKYGSAELQRRAKQMERQTANIEQQGMTRRNRKILRTDSYQLKNQQMAK